MVCQALDLSVLRSQRSEGAVDIDSLARWFDAADGTAEFGSSAAETEPCLGIRVRDEILCSLR